MRCPVSIMRCKVIEGGSNLAGLVGKHTLSPLPTFLISPHNPPTVHIHPLYGYRSPQILPFLDHLPSSSKHLPVSQNIFLFLKRGDSQMKVFA